MSHGALQVIDFRAQLAQLKRQPGAHAQVTPLDPKWITFHYSAVVYQDRSPAAEYQRVFAEARFHLAKDWQNPPKPGQKRGPPIYLSRYQYHYVVFSNGEVAHCNDLFCLAHVGNRTGNGQSVAVHVMLGGNQDVTAAQRTSIHTLFDNLRRDCNIPRERIVGHCEWPRGDGLPEVRPVYHQAVGQSECPGRTLFPLLPAYRTPPLTLPPPLGKRFKAQLSTWVRKQPKRTGAYVRTLDRSTVVQGTVLTGEKLTHPALGTSDQWVQIGNAEYVWLRVLNEVV